MRAQCCASIGRMCLIMGMYVESQQEMWSDLPCCAGDSLVKTSRAPGSAPGLRATDLDSGQSLLGSLASFDHQSRSWRTSQTCLLEGLERFSGSWPRSGMTRNGIAYQLVTLAHRSLATASGLLPTLVAGDAKGGRNGTSKGRCASDGLTMTDWIWLNLGRGLLHPGSAEQIMGFPIGWTDLDASATPSSRRSRKSSDGQS
jgi:hypothetical protein